MSKIEWCDITLNPIVGCSKCSPGCENCYAEKFAARLAKNPATANKYAGVVDENGKWTGKLSEKGWDIQTTLTKMMHSPPKRIFIGSMTDTFHENMDQISFNSLVLLMTYTGARHTFLLLTKRPAHALEMVLAYENSSEAARKGLPGHESHRLPKNVWLGVTVCNQEEADEKIPILLDIPATTRFISVEPMLGPVNLRRFFPAGSCSEPLQIKLGLERASLNPDYENGIHWVICGAETGRNARPLHPEWIRNLKGQCISAGVPFFFKSWGEWLPCTQCPDDMDVEKYAIGEISNDGFFNPPPCLESPFRSGTHTEQVFKVGKKRSGYLIDGVEYRQFPEVKNA